MVATASVYAGIIRTCRFARGAQREFIQPHLPTTAAHVQTQLAGRIPLVIDGGAAQVGIESTVIDLTGETIRILRPGMVSAAAIAAVLPGHTVTAGHDEGVLKSPGQLKRHYAPNARLLVMNWVDEADLEQQIAYSRTPHDRVCVLAHTRVVPGTRFGRVSVMPHEPAAYARALYGELHQCDAEGAELICLEAVPATTKCNAIADRLARAGALSACLSCHQLRHPKESQAPRR